MAISDGFNLPRLLVLGAQVPLGRRCIRVDLEVVDQEVFELNIRKPVQAELSQREQ